MREKREKIGSINRPGVGLSEHFRDSSVTENGECEWEKWHFREGEARKRSRSSELCTVSVSSRCCPALLAEAYTA